MSNLALRRSRCVLKKNAIFKERQGEVAMSVISRNRWRVSIGRPAPPVETVVVPRVRRSVRVRALFSACILLLACVVPLSFAAVSHAAGAATGADVGVGGRQADGRRGDVIANLFGWNWNSVAHECTRVLGAGGYRGGQGAPPPESLLP